MPSETPRHNKLSHKHDVSTILLGSELNTAMILHHFRLNRNMQSETWLFQNTGCQLNVY